jgi:hypothetical protein
MFGANASIDHLETLNWNSSIFEKASRGSRDSNGVCGSYVTEEGIPRTDNDGMSRMHNGWSANLLGGKACMQMSRVEMTMHYVWPLLFEHHPQFPNCFPVKSILIIRPGVDHLNALHRYTTCLKLLRKWTRTRANNFNVHTQLAKPLHKIQQVALSTTNHRIPNNLHNRKRHHVPFLKHVRLPDDKALLREEYPQERRILSLSGHVLLPISVRASSGCLQTKGGSIDILSRLYHCCKIKFR